MLGEIDKGFTGGVALPSNSRLLRRGLGAGALTSTGEEDSQLNASALDILMQSGSQVSNSCASPSKFTEACKAIDDISLADLA